MKIHTPTKIAIGFAVLVVGGYFAYESYSAKAVDGIKFPEIKPGKVTLLGVNAGQGYRIIVANQVAQLVEGGAEAFGPGEMSNPEASDTGQKRRIPLKEMLQTLQGDEEALSVLVKTMSDELKNAEIPPHPIVWEGKDLEAALNGDGALRQKLVKEIGVDLQGHPTGSITLTALMNGIVIRCPLKITVNIAGTPTVMTAHVMLPYRSSFTRNVEKALNTASLDPQRQQEQIQGFYKDEMDKEADRKNWENVALSLKSRIEPSTLLSYAEGPQRILRNTKVILNDDFVSSARYEQDINTQNTKLFNVFVELNEEGRKRVWQYSRHNRGAQLLLVVDGVAIAAPRIRNDLSSSEVKITQLPDESLVKDAVEMMNAKNSANQSK